MLVIFLACESDPEKPSPVVTIKTDSFETALPHGTALPSVELSDEDKIKIAKASGRQSSPITLDTLLELINRDTNLLIVYQFWNLDCSPCLKINDILQNLQYDSNGDSRFEIVHINTNALYPENVNAYIREKEIISSVYSLATDTLAGWSSQIDPSWTGEVPAMLIVKKSEGIRLLYQHHFEKEELEALIEPLTL